jgi:hypothetical protein
MKDLLHDAKALAAFSNLKESEVEYFRQNYSDFLPDIWSSVAVGEGPAWRVLQEQVAAAWRTGFTLDECVGLIVAVAKFSKLEIAIQKAEIDMLQRTGKLPTGPFPLPETWPFQRAVMFLGMNPWRASICSRCGNRYVKDKSTRRFCSDKCFQESRLLSKRSWWSEHGKDSKRKVKRRKK